MERVLQDVKCVQREINSIQGKVERTFTVTDEVIFRVAVFKLIFNNGSLSSQVLFLDCQIR